VARFLCSGDLTKEIVGIQQQAVKPITIRSMRGQHICVTSNAILKCKSKALALLTQYLVIKEMLIPTTRIAKHIYDHDFSITGLDCKVQRWLLLEKACIIQMDIRVDVSEMKWANGQLLRRHLLR
jgi:hypothetical protein